MQLYNYLPPIFQEEKMELFNDFYAKIVREGI